MRSPRSLKTISFAVLLLTLFFWAFFDISKKAPLLAIVNPFAEDPYDAVGSFGIQLSFFAALLSMLRAFRPYPSQEIPAPQRLLILRGETVALLSIVVTLAADLVAMVRYPFMWRNSPGGWILLGWIGVVIFLTMLTGLWLYGLAVKSPVSLGKRSWRRLIIFPLGLLLLAIYPADLQESVPGGILSALLGMVILFSSTWALATAIFPHREIEFEDVLDDLAFLYRNIASRIRVIPPPEKLADIRWFYRLGNWLNPRTKGHGWNLIILFALAMGAALLLAEAVNEGVSASANVLLLVIAVFIGIEGLGVIFGYFLFAEFLGIFRKE